MPGMDGTGPRGMGPLTGRGLGVCRTSRTSRTNGSAFNYGPGLGYGRAAGYGRGLGCGRGAGYGRGLGFGYGYRALNADRETLEAEKEFLQNRLSAIDEQLKKG